MSNYPNPVGQESEEELAELDYLEQEAQAQAGAEQEAALAEQESLTTPQSQQTRELEEIKEIVRTIYVDEDLMAGAKKIQTLLKTARQQWEKEVRSEFRRLWANHIESGAIEPTSVILTETVLNLVLGEETFTEPKGEHE